MYHSITFFKTRTYGEKGTITYGDTKKNTWDDWKLIPSSRPQFAIPQPSFNIVSIPGTDEFVDLSDIMHPGIVNYGQRSGSLQFIVKLDEWDVGSTWVTVQNTIMQYLHGQRLYCFLEDEPEYIYEGRFTLNAYKSGQSYSTITINYRLKPYKKYYLKSTEDWTWNEFNFQTGFVNTVGVKHLEFTETVKYYSWKISNLRQTLRPIVSFSNIGQNIEYIVMLITSQHPKTSYSARTFSSDDLKTLRDNPSKLWNIVLTGVQPNQTTEENVVRISATGTGTLDVIFQFSGGDI